VTDGPSTPDGGPRRDAPNNDADQAPVALADVIRRSSAAHELTLAIARRDAVLATFDRTGLSSVRELVALETGVFDSRTARQPGPSVGALAARQYLDALGITARDAAPLPTSDMLDRMARARAGAMSVPGQTQPALVAKITDRTRQLAHRLAALDDTDRARIDGLGKAAASSRRVHRALEHWPIASVTRLIDATGLQVQAVTSALHRLRGLGIVREITRRHRHRLYCHEAWLATLDADIAAWISEREAEP
jgi:hypothetical protein